MRRNALPLLLVIAAGCASPSTGEAPHAAPSSSPGLALPATTEVTLPNGMTVLLVPDDEVPLVSFQARFSGGAHYDGHVGEGAAAVLADLLRKGAGGRDARTFQQDVELVGGTFDSAAALDWIVVDAEFLVEDLDLAVELLSDALTRPRLDPAEFEKVRSLRVDRLKAAREEPNAVIDLYWNAWLYPDDVRGTPVAGDEAALARLTLAGVRRLWNTVSQPEGIVLAVAGDFEVESMSARLAAAFPVVKRPAASQMLPAISAESPSGGARVLLVDKPGALQTYLRFGGPGLHWTHPDFPGRFLANTILGGRFTSRLNQALRVEAGLTYGARSGFDDWRGGLFAVRTYTATDTSAEMLEQAQDVVRRFVIEGMTQAELDSARAYVKGQFAPDELETGAQVAGMLLDLRFAGRDLDVIEGLFQRLDALTLDEVNRVVSAGFPGEPWTWVLIGRADVLAPLADELGEVTRIRLSDPGWGPRSR